MSAPSSTLSGTETVLEAPVEWKIVVRRVKPQSVTDDEYVADVYMNEFRVFSETGYDPENAYNRVELEFQSKLRKLFAS